MDTSRFDFELRAQELLTPTFIAGLTLERPQGFQYKGVFQAEFENQPALRGMWGKDEA